MCGEHEKILLYGDAIPGSSPHVRGAPCHPAAVRHRRGIIPACAGSTFQSVTVTLTSRDHPRMCGEHRSHVRLRIRVSGSSPHVRGAPSADFSTMLPGGIIPACAGSTSANCRQRKNARDHPRMCGEHLWNGLRRNGVTGSSPHVRGAQNKRKHGIILDGIIPACAGSTSAQDYK